MRFVPFVVFCCLSLCPTASAQTSATLSGRVLDASQASIPGATITARHIERAIERTTVTGADGRFVLAALPVGTFDVTAELTGFKPVRREAVLLTVGDAVTRGLRAGSGRPDGNRQRVRGRHQR